MGSWVEDAGVTGERPSKPNLSQDLSPSSQKCPRPEDRELQELIDYLTARKPYIVNYNERRLKRQYMGSVHAEKACDLIVAKRQKNRGMHWSEATADALAAMKTVMLNQAWDLYWVDQQILPLATTP